MGWLFGKLLGWLGGGVLDKALGYLKTRADNETERQRIQKDIAIEHIRGELADRADARRASNEVRLATAAYWEMRLMTFLIALPFVDHLIAVWMDTRFGLYSRGGLFERCWVESGVQHCGVPKLPSPFDDAQITVLLSFFGVQLGGTAVKAVSWAIAKRGGR